MLSVRSTIIVIVNILLLTIIFTTYASAATVVMNFGNIDIEVERIDDGPYEYKNYYVNIVIPRKGTNEGIYIEQAVDVSSGTLPQMYLKDLNLITNNNHVEIYGWIDTDQIVSIYQWLKNIDNGYGELTFIREGRFTHYPITIQNHQTKAEAIAKLLLCVN